MFVSAWSLLVIHYSDVIMGAMASQISSLTIVYSTVYSGADKKKHQSSVSLAFVGEFTGSPHKGPVTRKMFPFDDVIICSAKNVWPVYLQLPWWLTILIIAFYIRVSQINYIHQCMPYPGTGMLLRRWWVPVMYTFSNWKCGNASVLYIDKMYCDCIY